MTSLPRKILLALLPITCSWGNVLDVAFFCNFRLQQKMRTAIFFQIIVSSGAQYLLYVLAASSVLFVNQMSTQMRRNVGGKITVEFVRTSSWQLPSSPHVGCLLYSESIWNGERKSTKSANIQSIRCFVLKAPLRILLPGERCSLSRFQGCVGNVRRWVVQGRKLCFSGKMRSESCLWRILFPVG